MGAAVVGTSFGCRVHVPALRNAGFEVHALVGRDGEKTARRAARLGVPHACTSLTEALDLPGVDAVTIAAPPHTHHPLVLEAVAAGRHVICEKPFALDATEAREMRDAAAAAGVAAFVGHEFRWAPDRALVARLIDEGAIGAPRLATLVSYVPLAADPDAALPEWWFDAGRGGGWLGASGSHVVDQVRTWLGEVRTVHAALPLVSDREVTAEDSFSVHLGMISGADVVLQQTAGAWGPMAGLTRVAGSKGSVWIDGSEVWLGDRDGSRVVEVPPDLALPDPPDVSDDPRHRYTHLELGPYTCLAETLRAAMTGTGAGPGRAATFDDGVACMEILDAVRQSARTGTVVELSPRR